MATRCAGALHPTMRGGPVLLSFARYFSKSWMLLSFACIEDAKDLSKDFFFLRAVEKVLCGGSRPAAGELFLQQPQGLLTLLLGRRWSLTMCFETGFLAHCWFCTSKGGEKSYLAVSRGGWGGYTRPGSHKILPPFISSSAYPLLLLFQSHRDQKVLPTHCVTFSSSITKSSPLLHIWPDCRLSSHHCFPHQLPVWEPS